MPPGLRTAPGDGGWAEESETRPIGPVGQAGASAGLAAVLASGRPVTARNFSR